MSTFNTIYKRTATGSIQQWTIFTDGNSYWTEEGQVNGVITKSKPTVCEAKNIGKANATSAEEQAVIEAKSKMQKKLDKGYFLNIKDIDNGVSYFEPMLAHKFEDRKDKIKYPVFVQRKSDGIRAIISKNGATTRNGKTHKCIPHILKALEPLFEKYPNTILDGELYNHDLHDDFNKISSLIRKSKPSQNDLEEAANVVEFHCYDVPRIASYTEQDNFHIRYFTMTQELQYIHPRIKIVATYSVDNEDRIKHYHEQFVSEGYEGIIIRLDAPYENKRSNNLLKFKEFDDDEFVIEGILPGKGNKANMASAVELHSKSGEYFTSNIKNTHDILENMLRNKEKYIGKVCTVRYFGLTPDKLIPRFPYVVDMDRWIYE